MGALVIVELEDMGKIEDCRRILKKAGYYEGFIYENEKYILPISSLWKPDISLTDAFKEVKFELFQNKIDIKKLFVFPSSPWEGTRM